MAGLSLVELMISMALGLIILAAVTTVFSNTSASRNELERTSRQIENGRYAVEILSDDLRLAGFAGELDVAVLPAPTALPDPCSTTATEWPAALPIHVQGYDNGAGAPACLPALQAGADVLVVRRVKTCVAGVAGCQAATAGQPYIQVSLCNTEMATTPYVLGPQGATNFNLTIRGCATAAGLRQYLVNIYFISTNNGAVPAQNVPTLMRMELTGAGWVQTPLVEGIEQLNLEYGIDTNGDGNADAYTADPTAYVFTYTNPACAGPCPARNWANVVTARFHLLARNIDASPGYTDNKTYNLGLDAAGAAVTYTPAGGDRSFRRHVYSGLVRIVNPAGRRDTP